MQKLGGEQILPKGTARCQEDKRRRLCSEARPMVPEAAESEWHHRGGIVGPKYEVEVRRASLTQWS